jgi:hypothetical protein
MTKESVLADGHLAGDHDGGTAEPFINKAETARRLSCGVRTLEAWMQRGILPYYKVSKRVMFRWSEVQAVLERNCKVDLGAWKV